MLLAGDAGTMDPANELAPALISVSAAEGEQAGSLGDLTSFGQSFGAALNEITRVIGAIESSPDLSQVIPYVGEVVPVAVGNATEVTNDTIRSIFKLRNRLASEVVEPVETFLASNPQATAEQLADEFEFIEPVVNGVARGVRLNLDTIQRIPTSVSQVIQDQVGTTTGLIRSVSGDVLSRAIEIESKVVGMSLDVVGFVGSDLIGVSIPEFSLDLTREDMPPTDFAAEVGFLSGQVVGGTVDIDVRMGVDLGDRFDDPSLDGTPLEGLTSLQTLSEISAGQISEAVELDIGGAGVNVALPFDFELDGLDHEGFLPVFTFSDPEPTDNQFPNFDLVIAKGASYTADAILAFHSINATEVLSSLQQFADVLGVWESGALLNFPIPLGDGVTLGDAIGLAESYSAAVLPFLVDDEGRPRFSSVQELGDLIPGLVADATDDAVVYDPATQTLNLSFDFFRQGEPITGQANINALVGNQQSPIATVQMNPGEFGTNNRFAITRNASLGLDLQIDLSKKGTFVATPKADVTAGRINEVQSWTPMHLIMERYGIGSETRSLQEIEVELRDGRTTNLRLGFLDENASVSEVVARGNAFIGNEHVLTMEFADDRLSIVDLTDRVGDRETTLGSTSTFFWGTVFGSGEIEDENGRINSQPLSGSTLRQFGPESTPLIRFVDPEDPANDVLSAPLLISLADGTDVTVALDTIRSMNVQELADLLTIERSGSPGELILETNFSILQGRYVFRDLTTPVSDQSFSINWAGGTEGTPQIARFVPIESDFDHDGIINGPKLIPDLPYDQVSPIDKSTTLDRIFIPKLVDFIYGVPGTAEFILSDGRPATMTIGPLSPSSTVGELMDQLYVLDGDEVVIEPLLVPGSDQIWIVDFAGGPGKLQFVNSDSDLLLSLFFDEPFIDEEILFNTGTLIETNSLSATGLYPSMDVFDLVPDHLRGLYDRPATVTLLDGTTHSLSVGPIAENVTRLADVLDRLQIPGPVGPKLVASLREDRIVLRDLSVPSGPDADFTIRFDDGEYGLTGFFLSNSQWLSGRDGQIEMDSLTTPRGKLPTVAPAAPQILVDTRTIAPPWTTVETLLARTGTLIDSTESQSAELTLSDGTIVQWTIDSPTTTSIAGVAQQAKWYRNENPNDVLIAEVTLENGRWIVHDKTAGTGTLELTELSGTLWSAVFGESIDDDDDQRLVSDPLQQTSLERFSGNVPLPWFVDPTAPENSGDAATLVMQLRDGETKSIRLGSIQSQTVLSLLEALTIRQNGRVIVSARFENGGILLTNRQPYEDVDFSIRMEDDGGSAWPLHFLTAARDVKRSGLIYQEPFFPELPDPNLPPAANSELPAGIRIDGATTIGDYAVLTGLSSLLDQPQTQMVVQLRDGTEVPFTVENDPTMSLVEYGRQFHVVRQGQTVLDSLFEPTGGYFTQQNYRFALFDRTEPSGGEADFRVMVDPSSGSDQNFNMAAFLGLVGNNFDGTGIIAGPDLVPDPIEDKVRLKLTDPPTLRAQLSAFASDVNAEIKVGELLGARLENGFGQATATVELTPIPPLGQDFLTLRDLLNSATNPGERLQVTVDADVEFGGEVYVDFAGINADPIPGQEPRIDFVWPDAITSDPNLRLQTGTLSFTHRNLNELLKFERLTVQDITNLVRKVVDLVERISGDQLLNRQLPLVNRSLGEVLDTVDRVSEIVDRIVQDPDATLETLEQNLESTLGLLADELSLSYLPAVNQLRLDLDLRIDPDQPTVASLNLDLPETGPLSALVDFQSSGNVWIDVGAELNLHLGLDLDELENSDFDMAVVVYDTTGITADAQIVSDNLSFTTTIATLGVNVGPGRVAFDHDGLPFGRPENLSPARVSIALSDTFAGAYTLAALSPADFDYSFDGTVGVDLPVEFLGNSAESLQIHWPDLNDFRLTEVASIDPADGNQIVLPNFSEAIDGFDLADGVYALAAGLEGLFGLIDDYLGDQVLGIPVPVVGEALGDLVRIADGFRDRLSDGLGAAGLQAEAARIVIYDILGPGGGPGAGSAASFGAEGEQISGGLNILGDLNGDGDITIDDVGFNLVNDGTPDDEVTYRLRLVQQAIQATTTIDVDLGGNALGLDLEADVSASFGFTFDIGFGISEAEGVFVEFFEGDELSLDLNASIANLMGEGRLGPLTVTARTLSPSELSEQQRIDARLDPGDPSSEAINGIKAEYQINLGDPAPGGTARFTLSELGSIFGSGVETQAAMVGSLHVQVETMIGGGEAGLPSIRADVNVNWDAVQGSLSDVIAELGSPTIGLSNVGLDLGGFISDVIAPVLEPINEFLDPIRPVLDAITTPLPVISDLIGETTFVDFIGLFGRGGQSVAKFIEAAADIARLIDIPIVNGNIFLPLGDFTTALNSAGKLEATEAGGAFGGQGSFDDFLNSLPDQSVREYLQDMPRNGANVASEPGKFSVPLLTNPASAVGLLLGQDVDLIKYQAPRLEAEFSYSQYIPIWPIFGITIGGSFSTVVDFAFGFDTAGIREFAATNDPLDLLDGIFLDDLRVDANGNVTDVAELQFRLGLTAGGALNVGIASAGVEGGLYAGVDLNLNDPNLDGKVRFQELADNFALGSHPLLGPLWIFDASGKLEAGASIYASAIGFKGELNIGPFTILDFDIPRPEPADPVLAHQEPDGTLIVHVGPNASLRAEGDLSDGADDILIAFDEDTQRTVVSGFGRDQSFSGVTSVFIDSGAEDDNLVIDAAFLLPVTVLAGAGNDTVQAGGGPTTIRGQGGDDNLIGSSTADDIDGGSGNDMVDGRDGNDLIRGGAGDDLLRGGGGADRIYGDGGRDTLSGGLESDFLFGGDDDDTLSGDEGDDVLVGDREDGSGFGNDFLQGGTGADVLRGGPRNDQLYGGPGSDQLFGEAGDDLLVGGSAARNSPLFTNLQSAPDTEAHLLDGGTGNDRIYGTAGIDTVIDLAGLNIVDTYESNDTITLGSGDDQVNSGDGEDTVNVGDGDNTVFTGAGFDIVFAGIGSDLIDLRPAVIGQGNSFGSEVTDAGGDNRILGDSGRDVIIVHGGDNYIDAGDGDNTVNTAGGNDTIRTGTGIDTISAGEGNNDVGSGAGDDNVTTLSGDDRVRLGSGNDVANTGGGNDVISGDAGNDLINAGLGNDLIRGGAGDDTLIGDRGNDTIRGDAGDDIIWGGLQEYSAASLLAASVHPSGYSLQTSIVALDPIVPLIVSGFSIPGVFDDGADLLRGGDGDDIIFGGGQSDDIEGGGGANYIDGGSGDEVIVGGSGPDVIRGGGGNDDLSGGGHLDFLFGDEGDDTLRGDSGTGVGDQTFGQKLFGGPGDDVLFAYAASVDAADAVEKNLLGDYLDGGDGADELFGNLRQETLDGGRGEDLLEGDSLAGPNYASNPNPRTTGGGDTIFGGPGEDLLIGGGGNDALWGGGDTDVLEGHAGIDLLAGGSGIDFLYLDVDPTYAFGGDTLDGHRDNRPGEGVSDDFVTDVLVIPGTIHSDTIELGAIGDDLEVNYNSNLLRQPWRDANGIVTIEQFQIDGLGGNDTLGFLDTLDLTELAERSRDWVGVINGGTGHDTILGSQGRDRISGGPGDDTLYGFGGDDRLWGDELDGNTGDKDRLFAGQGNDDLIGGIGKNFLYAWSSHPGAVGPDFGIFVDPVTGVRSDTAQPGYEREDTGLNRMLGRDGDDQLFAGTGLDFMYGGDGNNTLFDPNGIALEFGIGVPADEQWLEYARSTDKVWYYGGSGSSDVITVDYVTEPGVLGDHHLITRLTENNGFFTFDAQVKLDFAATNADGTHVWNPLDIVQRVDRLNQIEDIGQRRLFQQGIELEGNVLPPEGDYLAIIVDAKEGDDQVFVGPTVQRSVWVAAGEGDDRVEFASGSPLLVDLADTDPRNEVSGEPDDFSQAFLLDPISVTTLFTDLTLDSPSDVDWYEIDLSQFPDLRIGGQNGGITIDSISVDDQIELRFYELDGDFLAEISTATPAVDHDVIDPSKSARWEIPLNGFTFDDDPNFRYFIRVKSNAAIPTQYDLGLSLGEGSPLSLTKRNLGVETDTFLRRDVIVGGPGADVLLGGPSEDWVIGGAGNDVLSGGLDGTASDLLIGEGGDDILQVIPNFIEKPETLTDELEGGDGFDRILFLGGDVDKFGRPVNDHVTLNFNIEANRYELAAMVWDTANQRFAEEGGKPIIHEAYYRARGVEATVFDLRSGDDQLHLETGYELDGAHFVTPRTYGISAGDRQAGGDALIFEVLGGDGNDRIFGSPYGDLIRAGDGIDLVLGYGGADQISGDQLGDLLIGGENTSNVDLFDALEVNGPIRNDSIDGATWIDLSAGPVSGLTLHDGDAGDWYLVPKPTDGSTLTVSDFGVVFADPAAKAVHKGSQYSESTVSLFAAVLDPTTGDRYIPTAGPADAYLLHVRNPRTDSIIGQQAPRIVELAERRDVELVIEADGQVQPLGTFNFSVGPGSGSDHDNNSATPNIRPVFTSEDAADELNLQFQDHGVDRLLVADFDPRLNRLAITTRGPLSITIRGAANTNIDVLGFADGQNNTSLPGPLGTYAITPMGISLPPLPGNTATLPAELFSYDLVNPDLLFAAPLPTIDLSQPNPSVDAALRIEGDRIQNEQLSAASPIGDVNGDGAEDVILWGIHTAYVFLGELDPQRDVTLAGQTADYVINLERRSPVNIGFDDPDQYYRVIPSVVDIDGDQLNDLTFYSVSDSGVVRIDTILAADLANQTRSFDAGAASLELAVLLKDAASIDIDFQWLQFNSDGIADLMVISQQPDLHGPGNPPQIGYGGVINGAWIESQINGGSVPNSEQFLVFVNAGLESATSVESTLGESTSGGTIDDVRLRGVAGDFDGDGLDEIALALPDGWNFKADPVDLSVARVYVLDTGGLADTSITLGDAQSPAQIQAIAEAEGGQFTRHAALNLSTPLLAADFDFDGISELVLAREFDVVDSRSDQAVMIFSGSTLSDGDLQFEKDALVTANNLIDSDAYSLMGLSMSAGDFDGDWLLDLAVGVTSADSSDGLVTILYNPLEADPVFDVHPAHQYGDRRIDAVRIVGSSPQVQLGSLMPRSSDVSGDRIADLLIGSATYDGTADGVLVDSGAVFVVAGARCNLPLPDESEVTVLSNVGIRGLGEVLDTRDGPIEFGAGDSGLTLPGNQHTTWFKFRTIGDGASGDLIRLGPSPVNENIAIAGIAGSVTPAGDAQSGLPIAQVGGSENRTGVIEFDLSTLLSSYEDASDITGAEIVLRGSASAGEVEVPTFPDGLTVVEAGNGFPERVFFAGTTDSTGKELWVTDGTPGGTRLVFDSDPGPSGGVPSNITAVGHRVVFTARVFDGDASIESLYISDGVTTKVVDPPNGSQLYIAQIVEFDGDLYVAAFDESTAENQFWKVSVASDGSTAMEQLTSVSDSEGDLFISNLISTDSGVFFSRDVSAGEQLWFSDGTKPGTELISTFAFDARALINPAIAFNGGLLFVVDGSTAGQQLWFSDGSSRGTEQLAGVDPLLLTNAHAMVELESKIFFVANDNELWISDATPGGTKFVRQLFSADPRLTRRVKAVAVSGTYVAVDVIEIGRIEIVSVLPDGSTAASHTITGSSAAFVSQVAELGGLAAVSYGIDPGPSASNTRYLAMFDPLRGGLENLFGNDDNSDRFDRMVSLGDELVISGPRLGDVTRRQIWTSDGTVGGTEPLGVSSSAGGSAGLNVVVRAANHDRQVTAEDIEGSVLLTRNVALDGTDQLFAIDLAAGGLDTLHELFALGYRSIAVTITSSGGEAQIETADPNRGTGLFVTQRGGVTGQLLDQNGGLVADEFSALDLRDLKAGTYYLRISRIDTNNNEPIPLSIFVDAPGGGTGHTLADNDTIRGGEGNDILVGGPGRDALFGDIGIDTFVGERFEPRDREPRERLRDPSLSELLTSSAVENLQQNPRIVIGSATPPPGSVAIGDAALAARIAEALGVPIVVGPNGQDQFSKEVRQSDLGGITRLDASSAGIANYSGLQYLVGLETLDLSGNGTLGNDDLALIAPADNNATGMPHLRHLNLDGNRIFSLDELQGLHELTVLSVADQQHAIPLENIGEVADLLQLQYADVSGNGITDLMPLHELDGLRVADIADNPIVLLGPLTGTYFVDDSPLTVQPGGEWIQTSGAGGDSVGGTHHTLSPIAASVGAAAAWRLTKIPAGSYEILATWHADYTHSIDAQFEIQAASVTNSNVNQQQVPSGPIIGGKPFQAVGTITVDDNATIDVFLTAGADNGLVIADAIVVRPAVGTLSNLRRVDARQTLLDIGSRQFVVDDLRLEPRQVVVDLTDNSSPTWSDAPDAIAIESSAGLLVSDLNLFASDPEGTGLTFAGSSNHNNLSVVVSGSELRINATGPLTYPVTVVLTATDADGLSTDHYLTVAVDASLVQGLVRDSRGLPVEGALVFNDANEDGTRQSNESSATTGRDGKYQVLIADRNQRQIAVLGLANWILPAPIDAPPTSNVDVISGIDFTITRAVAIDLVPSAEEGTALVATAIAADNGGNFRWSITGGPVDFVQSNSASQSFTPLNEGQYTVSLNYELNGQPYSDTRVLPILPVAPRLNPGDDVIIAEGPLGLTREIIVDPGADTWRLTIDYGDGSRPVKLEGITDRTFNFDHIYADEGVFTVDVIVENDEGSDKNSFDVFVRNSKPTLQLGVGPSPIQGQPVGFEVTVIDPSFQADRFVWQYSIDWGDGSSDDLAPLLTEIHPTEHHQTGTPTHVFEQDGTYTIMLTVVDDDGETHTQKAVVNIGNDVPSVVLQTPPSINEDQSYVFALTVADADDQVTISWDFGDGSPNVVGSETSVSHRFVDPGTYTISATVDDGDGGVTNVQQVVTVLDVAESPTLGAIARLRVIEGRSLEYTPLFSDPDPAEKFSFSLSGAPQGFAIDPASGRFSWTPTTEQGAARYDFQVLLTDSTGLSTQTPVSIDVVDTGSIAGQVFHDIDINGTPSGTDTAIFGATVQLDIGDDGIIDQSIQTDENGEYRFAALPLGLYRITATLPTGFQSTTPTSLLVNMVTPRDVRLPAVGGSEDVDGDGLTNEQELNSPVGIDGNDDGIGDWLQSNVLSAESPGAGPITFVGPAGSTIRDVQFNVPETTPPRGGSFPYGAIQFDVEGLVSGARASVDLILHDNPSISVAFTYRQSQPNRINALYQSIGHSVDGDRITVQPHDGSQSDLDGAADGRVTEEFLLSDANLAWQNPANRFDVNNSGDVKVSDALIIINRLGEQNPRLPQVNNELNRFYDVNGDGRATAVDVLQIINELARLRTA